MPRFIKAVVFQLVMLLWSYFSVVFTDPGGVPANWKPVVDEEKGEADLLAGSEFSQLAGEPTNLLGVRYCRKCNQLEPPRCHHCSVCERCVLKMDHHCVWVVNCVGALNYKYFLLFLFYTFLETTLVALSLLPHFIMFFSDEEIPGSPSSLATTFLAFVLNLAIALSVFGFLIMHISLVAYHTTTIEAYEKKTSPKWRFDFGRKKIFEQVFGAIQQLKDVAFPSSVSALHSTWKPSLPSTPQPPTPPFCLPPSVPTSGSTSNSRPSLPCCVVDSLKKTNELLNQEVNKLQSQIKNLKQKSENQDAEVRKLQRNVQEATKLATEKSSRCSVATEIMKEISENSPPEISQSENFKSLRAKAESFLRTGNGSSSSNTRESGKSKSASADGRKKVREQFEPGVYVTRIQLANGSKIFERVNFSKRVFTEQQAEEWWKANKDRLLKKYSASKKITTTSKSRPSGENGASS